MPRWAQSAAARMVRGSAALRQDDALVGPAWPARRCDNRTPRATCAPRPARRPCRRASRIDVRGDEVHRLADALDVIGRHLGAHPAEVGGGFPTIGGNLEHRQAALERRAGRDPRMPGGSSVSPVRTSPAKVVLLTAAIDAAMKTSARSAGVIEDVAGLEGDRACSAPCGRAA